MADEEQQAGLQRVHAFGDDALGEHDAVGLVEEIRSGRLSRQEVVDAAIARTRRLDETLHGVAADRFAAASGEASTPHEGYFAGLPSFVKDNSDVAGLPTQHGTRAFVASPARSDGDYARMFRPIGTTILGKTRLSEYGFSPSAEYVEDPPVRNPWDTAYSSGASSAGSAALVAAGAVPLAHANDGGGSIRIPAACTGLVGLKPTRGRVPGDKMNREMPVRIVADGVVTRSVRDTAAFLRESERVYRTLKLPPIGDVTRPGRKRLRIALVTESIGGRRIDDEVVQATQKTAALLAELGHHVEEVAVPAPDSFEEDFLLYWGALSLAVTGGGRRMFGPDYDRHLNDNLTKGLVRHSLRHLWRLPLATARLQRSHRISEAFYRRHDVVLSPVLAQQTPQLGWLNPGQSYETVIGRILEWVAFTPLQNATGDPAISLPLAQSSRGLPIGVQVAAAQGRERTLLELAYELEEARPFARIQG